MLRNTNFAHGIRLERWVIAFVGFGVALGFSSWYVYRLLKDVIVTAVRHFVAALVRKKHRSPA